jgi:hypothetical protein
MKASAGRGYKKKVSVKKGYRGNVSFYCGKLNACEEETWKASKLTISHSGKRRYKGIVSFYNGDVDCCWKQVRKTGVRQKRIPSACIR